MKTYTVYRSFRVEAEREFSAESMADAVDKAFQLRADRWFKAAPGASLTDWENMSGTQVAEERE